MEYYYKKLNIPEPYVLRFQIGHFFNFFKITQKSLKNTPNALKNTLKWFALIFEVFFKSRKSAQNRPKSEG
jgi:hypothetical protein